MDDNYNEKNGAQDGGGADMNGEIGSDIPDIDALFDALESDDQTDFEDRSEKAPPTQSNARRAAPSYFLYDDDNAIFTNGADASNGTYDEYDPNGSESGYDDGYDEAVNDSADGSENDGEEEEVNIPSMIFDIVETLAVAASAIVLLFLTVFRVAMVSGDSMNKTLFNKDVLIVSDLGFEPRTGDIVVFQKIGSRLGEEALVKRVIATEGQTIDIDFDTWTVTVDGKVLDESEYRYLAPDAFRTSDLTFPITLGKGEVFVMGDNRNHSTDSRSSDVGIVDERTIFGRVVVRISPLSDFRIFGRSKDAG